MTTIRKGFLLFILLSLSTMAFSDTLAIEQFDYGTGSLHLSNGGSGWFREWRTQNDILTGYEIMDSNPLTFPELVTTGNYCSGGIAWTTAGRFFDPAAFPGYIDGNGRIGVGSFYFSFLIRKENADATPVQIVFADAAGAEWSINEELIKIGYLGDTYGGQYWGVSVSNDDNVALSDSLIRVGESYRIVCEIAFGTPSTVNIWINPDVYTLNPAPDASVSTNNDIAFWNMVLSFVDGGSDEGSFDEFVFTDDIGNILPVEYLEFYAEMGGSEAILHWSTVTEINNDRFVIQHSPDGIIWNDIGTLPGRGDANRKSKYSFPHDRPEHGLNYYRLKQIDFDGTQSISGMITYFHSPPALNRGVTYAHRGIYFLSTKVEEMKLHDILGRVVYHNRPLVPSSFFEVGNRPKGVYIVTAFHDGQIIRRRVLID